MDYRALGSPRGRRFQFSFLFVFFALTACGSGERFESVMPAASETCGGTAIQSRYIVHFHSGKWDFVENADRENFKENYVRPKIDEIDFIEYDQKITPSAGEFMPAAGIDNWGIPAINAPAAWQQNQRGTGVVVAVIDSGVDITHQQLSSQILFNAGEAGAKRTNGIDDDGNGYVDDYAGFNFNDGNGDVFDQVGHGTHVSGIIGAAHNDTVHRTGYPQGVAPGAKILPVKTLGPGGGSLSAALQGIDYAVLRGANVINASWGGPGCSQALRQKVSDVTNQNVLFIVASGNSGNNLDLAPEYPAAFSLPLQITVGAIRSSLTMDAYSNYSRSLVHIFAPGTMVVSTLPDNSVGASSGTSMAAPFVSGAAALVLGANPSLTSAQVRDYLLNAVDTEGEYMNSTSGRLNVGRSVDAMSH